MKNFSQNDSENFNRDDSRSSSDNNLSQFKRDKRVRTRQVQVEKVERVSKPTPRPYSDHPTSDRPREERNFNNDRAYNRRYDEDNKSGNRSYGNRERGSYNPNFTHDNKLRDANRGDNQNRYSQDNRERSNTDRPDRPRFDSDKPRFNNDKPRFGDDKPRFGGDKPRFGGGDRPNYNSDKPRFGDDKPRFGGDKPRYDSDKPRFNSDKPRFGGDKPRFGGDKPRFGDDKPRFGGGDRPNYNSDKPRFGGDKPNYNSDKPRFGGDKPRYNSDKPRFGDDKPRFGGDKPRFGGDKPRYNSDKPRFGDKPRFDGERGSRPDRFQKNDDRKPFRRDGDKPAFTARPKYDADNYPQYPAPKFDTDVRLNRYVATSGVCSRREADEYIQAGQISVNDVVITELGTKVKATDVVKFNGEVVMSEKKVYIVMNKPKGYVTTIEDEHADKTVMELLKDACKERVYPVGRLDKNSVGVLLFTNDGDLTKKLTHPTHNKKKVYQVSVDKAVTRADMEVMATGIELEDGEIYADEIAYVGESKKEVGMEIHSGRNRIVRRIFEHCGYKVLKLDRVYFAGLTKKNLRRGAWRFLTSREVSMLKSGEYE